MKTILLFLSLISLFFTNPLNACDVSYTTSNGQIQVSGLTATENTKLFDIYFNSVWDCSPWTDQCNPNEVISGLLVGETYYLSVVSDNCNEWITITVEGDDNSTATCSDGIQNQGETDIDCGGPCAPCPTTPTCNDGIQNQGETGIDCGGPCTPCPSSGCNVSVNSSNGNVIVVGLTNVENAKLFDSNVDAVWGCNPWSGTSCSGTESITGLIAGATYFLSVQSDNCDEWIPITVQAGGTTPTCSDGIQNQGETGIDCGGPCAPCPTTPTCSDGIQNQGETGIDCGGPCAPCPTTPTCNDGIQNQGETGIDCGGPCAPCPLQGCNVSVSTSNGNVIVTGLTNSENAKLFDANVAAVWECNPWSGTACSGNETITGLTTGATYFLSVQSDECDEWISVTVEGEGSGGNNSTDCTTVLENYNPDCFQSIPEGYGLGDGSFKTQTAINSNTAIENNYSNTGELISSNNITTSSYGLSVSSAGVISGTTSTDNNVNVNIDPTFLSTYTTGNNFFKSDVATDGNGSFFAIGVEVGDLFPTTLGFSNAPLEVNLHQFDLNGNEISSHTLKSLVYFNIDANTIADKVSIIGMVSSYYGEDLEIFLEYENTIGPGNASNLKNISWYSHIIGSNYNDETFMGNSTNDGVTTTLTVNRKEVSDLVNITYLRNYSKNGVTTSFLETNLLDYSGFAFLVGRTRSLTYSGPDDSYISNSIAVQIGNNEVLSVNQTTDLDGSNPTHNYTITDLYGEIILTNENFDVFPDELIPLEDHNFNYIVNGVLYYPGDCDNCVDSDNDGICDEEDCQPNDAAFPTTPGSTCDDLDNTTSNDIIQSDGCTCVGEPVATACNVAITSSNESAIITGLTSDANVKLFNANYSVAFECNPWSGSSCPSTVTVDNLNPGGTYFLSVLSDNCDEWIPITIENAVAPFQEAQQEKVAININNLFPNPASDELFVKIESNADQNAVLKIFNTNGTLVQSKSVDLENDSNTVQFDISNLPKGLYNLTIENDYQFIETKRFVKF